MFEVGVQCYVPCTLVGANGIGKTSRIKALAEVLNRTLIRIPLLGLEPSDLTGLPILRDNHVEFIPPKFITDLKTNPQKYILLLDEINRIPPDKVQALICQLLDREHGIFGLPYDVMIVGTCNVSDLGVFKPSKMLRSRMAWFTIQQDTSAFLEYLKEGRFNNDFKIVPQNWKDYIPWARNLMYLFLSTHRSLLYESDRRDDDDDSFPYCTPRSFDMTINIWAGLKSLRMATIDNLAQALQATCGHHVQHQFMQFLSKMELPNVETFVKEYLLQDLEYTPDKYNMSAFLYLMLSEVYFYMIEVAQKDPNYASLIWKASMKYIERYLEQHEEICMMLIRMYAKADKDANRKICGMFPPKAMALLQKVIT